MDSWRKYQITKLRDRVSVQHSSSYPSPSLNTPPPLTHHHPSSHMGNLHCTKSTLLTTCDSAISRDRKDQQTTHTPPCEITNVGEHAMYHLIYPLTTGLPAPSCWSQFTGFLGVLLVYVMYPHRKIFKRKRGFHNPLYILGLLKNYSYKLILSSIHGTKGRCSSHATVESTQYCRGGGGGGGCNNPTQ